MTGRRLRLSYQDTHLTLVTEPEPMVDEVLRFLGTHFAAAADPAGDGGDAADAMAERVAELRVVATAGPQHLPPPGLPHESPPPPHCR